MQSLEGRPWRDLGTTWKDLVESCYISILFVMSIYIINIYINWLGTIIIASNFISIYVLQTINMFKLCRGTIFQILSLMGELIILMIKISVLFALWHFSPFIWELFILESIAIVFYSLYIIIYY